MGTCNAAARAFGSATHSLIVGSLLSGTRACVRSMISSEVQFCVDILQLEESPRADRQNISAIWVHHSGPRSQLPLAEDGGRSAGRGVTWELKSSQLAGWAHPRGGRERGLHVPPGCLVVVPLAGGRGGSPRQKLGHGRGGGFPWASWRGGLLPSLARPRATMCPVRVPEEKS